MALISEVQKELNEETLWGSELIEGGGEFQSLWRIHLMLYTKSDFVDFALVDYLIVHAYHHLYM